MTTDDPQSALREFNRTRSEPVFRKLVAEYSPVVFGTALRKLNGDRSAAQDVTQEVFTLLVRKASRLESVVLGGWLYRQTCRRAANHVRSETRRKQRESISMETLSNASSPHGPLHESLAGELDDALSALPAKDRDALVLRFFEGKDFKGLGGVLGVSEEAARKRVARALERLGGKLRRRGIAVGGVSLGTAMEGFGASPLPAEMVSQLSRIALSASASSGAAAFASLFKPMAAGVLAGSLVTGSTLAIRQSPAASAEVGSSPALPVARTPRVPARAGNILENPTLEQIIEEIRRIRSGPGNVLSDLRLRVALGKVEVSRIPEFIALGNARLNLAERQEIYQPLLTLWWNQDPDAALTFILTEKIGPWIKGIGNNYLLGELFRQWVERDRSAAESWLLRNWQDETLQAKHGRGTFANFLSMWITGDLFGHEDVAGVFAFAMRLPTSADQAGSIAQLVGLVPLHTSWTYSDGSKEQWREFYRGLENFPDENGRAELIRSFWKDIGEKIPQKAAEIRAFIQPADPFMATLGMLAVRNFQVASKQNLSGSTSYASVPVPDRGEREAAAIEVGLAEGMTRGQILNAMGIALSEGLEPGAYFAWLDDHRGELALDDFLAAKARERAVDGRSIGGRQADAIQWASRISDPDLRGRLCRAAFRRMLARGSDVAVGYLAGSDLPEDFVAEFQTLANEEP